MLAPTVPLRFQPCRLRWHAAFFISDRTGITAEMLGHSLLTQFESVRFQEVTLPFVDTIDKAHEVVTRINERAVKEARPIVISTLVNTEIAEIVGKANALFLDCFEIFISPLEKELGVPASHAIGRSHGVNDIVNYYHRIDAVNYALGHDDGIASRGLGDADIILVGVSRSGKTPTCLYGHAVRHPRRELSVRARRLRQHAVAQAPAAAARPPAGPHDQARTPAADPQRAATREHIRDARELRVRGARSREPRRGRVSLSRRDEQVGRGSWRRPSSTKQSWTVRGATRCSLPHALE